MSASTRGKLRRAPGEKDRASSSVACRPAKKKKSSVKVVKVSTPVPTSSSASILSASTSTNSSISNSEGDSSLSDFERSDLSPRHFEPEPIALYVINEPKVEEGMATDLRANFKERHCKRLHEAIEVVACLTKRTCSEGVQGEPMKNVFPMPMPPPDAAGSSSVSAAGKETCPTQD